MAAAKKKKAAPAYAVLKGGLSNTCRLIRIEIVVAHSDYDEIATEADDALRGMCSGKGGIVSSVVLDMKAIDAIKVLDSNINGFKPDWNSNY